MRYTDNVDGEFVQVGAHTFATRSFRCGCTGATKEVDNQAPLMGEDFDGVFEQRFEFWGEVVDSFISHWIDYRNISPDALSHLYRANISINWGEPSKQVDMGLNSNTVLRRRTQLSTVP